MGRTDLMGRPGVDARLAVRCHARSKTTGTQCGRLAMLGATVCNYHGGRAPQVQRKAAERVAAVRDMAVQRLTERLEIDGDHVDPKVLLDCIVKLGAMVELLEGRATGRTESITAQAEQGAQVRERLRGALDELARRRDERAGEEGQRDS